MKNFYAYVCAMFIPGIAMAQEFAFDGLNYSVIDAEKKTCSVAGFESAGKADLVIPGTVSNGDLDYTVIGVKDQAFFQNDDICKLTLPNTLLSVGEFSFCWCTSLSDITFGNSLETIGENAFNTCSSLKAVVLPEGLKTIGEGAFSACKLLTTVTIPSTVSEIGINVFGESPNMSEINVAEGNSEFLSMDGVLLSADCSEIIQYPCGNERTDYVIPEGVTDIQAFAFGNCNNLKNVTFSSTVKSLDEGAFYTCESLESIKFNEGLETIGRYAFASAGNLSKVEIPSTVMLIDEGAFMSAENIAEVKLGESVESIGQFAFYGCQPLSEIILPAKLGSIGMYSFDGTSIKSVKSLNPVPPVCQMGAFSSKTVKDGELYVPSASVDAYRAAAVWKDFVNVKTDTQSGIESVAGTGVSVKTLNGEIFVLGVSDGVIVEVYNGFGTCVYSGKDSVIDNLGKGIYIVRIGREIFKVAI